MAAPKHKNQKKPPDRGKLQLQLLHTPADLTTSVTVTVTVTVYGVSIDNHAYRYRCRVLIQQAPDSEVRLRGVLWGNPCMRSLRRMLSDV